MLAASPSTSLPAAGSESTITPAFARSLRAAELLASRGATPQARLVVDHLRKAWGLSLADLERRKLLKLEARLSMAGEGSTVDAAAVLEELIKLDPLDGEALMLLGQHYSRQNQPDRAMLCYERAAGIESFEVNAKLRHAQVLVGLRRYSDALPLLRRAQEVKPREDVARYLEQVERAARADAGVKAAKAEAEAKAAKTRTPTSQATTQP